MTRRAWILLGALLVVEVAVLRVAFVAAPHPGGDNAGYVALAHSLVSGQGYTELWDPATPPHTKYPPVFPLLLAAAMALGARGWVSLKLVPLAAAVLAVAAAFLWGRRRLGDAGGFAVALLLGLSPAFLYHSHFLLSDVPFLAFTLLGLLSLDAAGSAQGGSGDAGPELRRAGAAAVLVGMAYFTRSAGLPLLVAGIAAMALRRRRRASAVLLAGVGVPGLLWALRARAAGPGEGAYGSEVLLLDPYRPDLGRAGAGDFAVRVLENLAGYVTDHLPRALIGGTGMPARLLVLALLALALAGWIRAVRRKAGAAELFLPLYAGLILVWPTVWSGDRFALPLVPLLIVFAGEALLALRERLPSRLRIAVATGAVLAVAAPAAVDLARVRGIDALCREASAAAGPWACGGAALVDFAATARWAGENLPPDAFVLTRKPRIWYLESGLPTRTYPFTAVPGAFLAEARGWGAEYVVLDYVSGQGEAYVAGAMGEDPASFCQVGLFGGVGGALPTRLLGILPEGSASGSGLEEGSILLATCEGAEAPVDVMDTAAPGPEGWRIPLLDR